MKYLVCYMTLGYPNSDTFLEFIDKSQNLGCDILEIGIPTNNAKYDGPTIKSSYKKVNKINIENEFKNLSHIIRKPTLALTYLEDHENDLENFLKMMKKYNFAGVLMPDLIIDYIGEYKKYHEFVKRNELNDVIFVSPTVPDKILKEVSEYSDLFLYYGIRPTTGIPIPISPDILVKRVRPLVSNKLIVGFGLSNEDINSVIKAGADGIAIGTAFIKKIDSEGLDSSLNLVKELRGILDET
ncbi:tryptophan synthase, alpha subunit [Caldisphaera lagunensis DSM 15908]|uniref:tryptophan synthase n=1 Tax=Caldisphaera lagunensis (strain DSM 15908 / JCM 11604 / ANMR 0165 / IC-154) TaxID=1056495 RepID=L0A9S0_CALLD|nr:tryptophan synthase subunit alpha [Caldisphaera lagunensis]AFZ69892.1 tryptophan synthase, alpha subunit [Caldisphaera lagunensis DSM 15908]